MPRSHEWGTKRGWLVGNKGPAPWRNVGRKCPALGKDLKIDRSFYVDNYDFERYRPPPMNVHREDYLVKNQYRRSLSEADIKRQPNKWSTGRRKQFGLQNVPSTVKMPVAHGGDHSTFYKNL